MVKDINPDRLSDPHAASAIGDEVYFRADDGVHGSEVWKSDGTARGTKLVRDVAPGSSSSLGEWLDGWTFGAGDLMYFLASDGRHGLETWRTDGTERGTFMMRDVVPGDRGSSPTPVMQGDGLLFLTMFDLQYGLGAMAERWNPWRHQTFVGSGPRSVERWLRLPRRCPPRWRALRRGRRRYRARALVVGWFACWDEAGP